MNHGESMPPPHAGGILSLPQDLVPNRVIPWCLVMAPNALRDLAIDVERHDFSATLEP